MLFVMDDSVQVLHMDRNDYYGGESTSLNLNQVSFISYLCFFFYYCYFLPLTVLNDYLIDLSV